MISFVTFIVVISLVPLVTTTTTTTPNPNATCEAHAQGHDFLEVNGQCLVLVQEGKFFLDSMDHCITKFKGHGAWIESEAVLHIVQNWLNDMYAPIQDNMRWWIGLQQLSDTVEPRGGWAWVSGDWVFNHTSNPENTPWHSDQPDNNDDAGYGALWYDGQEFGIDDIIFGHDLHSICEIPMK